MERQPSPYKANCVSSWKSTNLTSLVEDPQEGINTIGKPKKNAINYNLAVRYNCLTSFFPFLIQLFKNAFKESQAFVLFIKFTFLS